MLIDTHAHLWWNSYEDGLEEVISRAKVAGVEKMIVPGTDLESSRKAIELAEKYPGVIYAAVGIHPEEVLGYKSSDLSFASLQTALRSELRGRTVAIGEIGTDASSEELKSCMKDQQELFGAQCREALELDLPVIIHTRETMQETLEVLDSLPAMPRGQFHCFSNSEEDLQQALSRGFYISFCGNITWSKRVRKLVTKVPDNRLLLETDSPFMTPIDPKVPNTRLRQGSELARNEPGNVRITAQMIANERGVSLEALAIQTTANARKLFNII